MNDVLAVIVQTSPIPSHPSTALLQALFRSFDRVDGIRECRILIVADGCDEIKANETEAQGLKRGKVSADTACRYREHLERLQEEIGQAPFHDGTCGGSVTLLRLPERFGSARAIEYAVNTHVTTPLVMICQHDNFFVTNVSLRNVVSAMIQNPWIKALHFTATATMNYVPKVKKRYGIPLEHRYVEQLEYPLIPLVFWFARTHVARTDYYRDFVLNRPLQIGQHLEELLGERQLDDIRQNGMTVHDLYGNYVMDQGEQVLYHLSGRRARAVSVQGGDSSNGNHRDHQSTLQQHSETAVSYVCNRIAQKHQTDSTVDDGPHTSDVGLSSFTTAQSRRAIVPGLEAAPAKQAPQGKFRQRCFHCGIKGHSYRFCPNVTTERLPQTQVVDLS